MPEILDSAQECFDHLWVNGEKYVFSEHVIESGALMFERFSQLKTYISHFYELHFDAGDKSEATLAADFKRLKQMLVGMDELWTVYEQKYVTELMIIEGDARRFIIDSINLEIVLGQEFMQQPPMIAKFNEKRKEMVEFISQVNAVVNVEGKGRDDFDSKLLEQSEQLARRAGHSRAANRLAHNVLASFNHYRQLMRQYMVNIELVDPQLRNNEPLVKVVSDFENAWCIAANQIGQPERLTQLDLFSKLLEKTQTELP